MSVRAAAGGPRGLQEIGDRLRAGSERLLDSFLEVIAPLCARWLPSQRLVVTLEEGGSLRGCRVAGTAVSDLGALADWSEDRRREIASAAWSAVELHVPPALVLRRSLKLPVASRHYIAPILQHRLERLTPWRPERIVHGYRVTGTDAEAIGVEFAAVPRQAVAEALAAIEAVGLRPTTLGPAPAGPADPLPIELPVGAGLPTRGRLRRHVARVWIGLTGGLAVLALASLLWASAVEGRSEEVAAELTQARRHLRGLVARDGGGPAAALLDAKRPEASAMLLIDRLSEALPEDSHLSDLQMTTVNLRLAGQSREAARLIGLLEAAGFANVRFTAPVTRGADGLESFELLAERPPHPKAPR